MIDVLPRESASTWLDLVETTPSLVFDPAMCRHKWGALSKALPDVTLHYAVKSNPYPDLLQTIAAEGGCFDVASSAEIKMLEHQGVHPSRMIHTHPVKTDVEIERAVASGVTTFVVDNVDELWKLIPYRHVILVMLRLSFIAPDAPIDLSRKFGAPVQDALSILDVANDSGIRIDGLCFHVGSQAATANTHADALATCLELCKKVKRKGCQRSFGSTSVEGFQHSILVTRLILIVLCANPRSAYECPRSYPNFGRAWSCNFGTINGLSL